MAITKVYAIRKNLSYSVSYAVNEKKTGLDGAIGYALNRNKTEQRLYQGALNCCSVETAYNEMQATKRRWGKPDGVLGYHFIQSFKPGEVTPEQAHEIGMEFARICFGDRFEAVVGTHLDKSHLHNHVVVNSVSFVDGSKYHSSPESYYNQIRAVSDKLCEENNLSVIENPKGKGKHYAEWKAEKDGRPTIRGQMRCELDEIIKRSITFNEFWRQLKRRGYIVHRRGLNIAHTSIIPPYGKRPIRLDSLGKGYTEEDIFQRIVAQRNGIRMAGPSELPKRIPMKNFKRRKLKGFMVLYFHYLYLFNRIQKHKAPQKVSFFMRSELTKLERYQKQFKFLHANSIEKMSQLTEYREKCEAEISELIVRRKTLYNSEDGKEEIACINERLRTLRSEVRMCGKIANDAVYIKEKVRQMEELMKIDEMQIKSHKKYRTELHRE